MSNNRVRRLVCVFVFFALATLPGMTPVSAQSGGNYELTWFTIDGGGQSPSTGSSYSLSGTIGQPDVGNMSGGDYVLSGGFWVDLTGFLINLPLIRR